MEKKRAALLVLFLFLINFVSAINLDVSVNPIQRTFISDLNEPAVLGLTITNLEEKDTFEIYSLVGVNIEADKVTLSKGESKNITIKITPNKAISPKKGPFIFEYKIKNSKNEIMTDELTINILEFKDSVSVTASSLNPKSETATITIENNINHDFEEITAKIDSSFFEFDGSFPLKGLEKKWVEVPVNKEKLKTSLAGSYLMNAKLTTKGVSVDIESIIKFMEQEDIDTSETSEGFLIKRVEISKKNIGNTEKTVSITQERNIISHLFTTFSILPTRVQKYGLSYTYTWEKALIPNESLVVMVKTNWLYPIIIIILVIFAVWGIKRYVESDLLLTKEVSFVRTRGGEFALRISIKAKARKFIQRIHILDKLPPVVALYKKFGAVEPDKIDEKNRRLEWSIESMNKNEVRIFSYIIYSSKIGVVGRFELPCAKAFFEKDNKVKTTESNRSFFINEPKREGPY